MIQRIKDAFAVLTGAKVATEKKPNTVVHKVEITVSTNQNAGAFARQVGEHISRGQRIRTSSPLNINNPDRLDVETGPDGQRHIISDPPS